jgi:trehalose/maltose hydrolase-like predicted phosphorylase
MNESAWNYRVLVFDPEDVELNGNRFLLGNGYLGYRGTLEEFTKKQRTGVILSGVYDKVGDCWREPVNAPNPLYTLISCDGEPLSVLTASVREHEQGLDFRVGVHRRITKFAASNGNVVTVRSERFADAADVHRIVMRCTFTVAQPARIVVDTGIDGDVWDLNGPHLEDIVTDHSQTDIVLTAVTHELRHRVAIAEKIETDFDALMSVVTRDKTVLHHIAVDAVPGREYTFTKYAAIYTSLDCGFDERGESGRLAPMNGGNGVREAALTACIEARAIGYDSLREQHDRVWLDRWAASDVRIVGDGDAQYALRYSIYHLLAIAPTHSDTVSIPARGLSAQVYKGAIFWDTEMFMLPFFLHTSPDVARNLVRYRIRTLDGARRKAAEYGFRGAYYAWESQDTGDDACTHYAFNDVFTGRPMRTYFRDKQIHISADVARGVWQYYLATGDESILLDGGAEVILECARFFISHAYFKPEKNRYELLDVTGPDEYHERVNNNAFTNAMARYTLDAAVKAVTLLSSRHPDRCRDMLTRIGMVNELVRIREVRDHLYVPDPDPHTLVIEQFDRYLKLEDTSVEDVKSRMLDPGEYLGGANGVASQTQIIKQADTVLMLHLFKDAYDQDVKAANWEFYEPRTEHGSSLSPCVYAIVAADIGDPEWAYEYFMKTATIDLSSHSRQTVGGIYIGGTHPAANGGAWMATVLGFAGVSFDGETLTVNPHLPSKWESLTFPMVVRGQRLSISITRTDIRIDGNPRNTETCRVRVGGRVIDCAAGQQRIVDDYR